MNYLPCPFGVFQQFNYKSFFNGQCMITVNPKLSLNSKTQELCHK